MQYAAADTYKVNQLVGLIAQLPLLIDGIEQINSAAATASLRVHCHQAIADLRQALAARASRRSGTAGLRQRHAQRAGEDQRFLGRMGDG